LRGSPAANGELRHVPRPLRNAAGFPDDRFGEAGPGLAPLKKVFPDHWTFLLREAATYAFVALIVTGHVPGPVLPARMRQRVYHGSYTRLGNLPMSQAYASALNISLEVRGGLPVRQIHTAGRARRPVVQHRAEPAARRNSPGPAP